MCSPKKLRILAFSLAVLFAFISICLSIDVMPITEGPTKAPLGCHKREYTYFVTQKDMGGHECWGEVKVQSCWGRCDSNEISDWKFPYKRSYHPVCVHAGRTEVIHELTTCHPLVEPQTRFYKYMQAEDCSCQACSSTDTSCEAPKQVHGETAIKILAFTGQTDNMEYE